jgi:hypothetical protein
MSEFVDKRCTSCLRISCSENGPYVFEYPIQQEYLSWSVMLEVFAIQGMLPVASVT